MMAAQGIVFLGQTKPLATKATDGTFALTLLAFDRIGPHQVEPWRITWFGPQAYRFWLDNAARLTAGQPLHLCAERLRNFTNGRGGAPELVVTATSLALAPAAIKRWRGCASGVYQSLNPLTMPTSKKATPTKAQSVTHCNSNTKGHYHPGELLDPPVRANAAQAFGLPSRVGPRLRHPCGRVTDLAGQPLPAGTVL